jgi:chemotaxis protein methyltransferase CheR
MVNHDPEIAELLEDVLVSCGADFSGWQPSHVAAVVRERLRAEGVASVGELRARLRDDTACLDRALLALGARPLTPFVHGEWVRALRTDLAPRLRTYPSVRVWVAGAAGGGDLYTTAIALREEKLLDRATIYATEETEAALAYAKDGGFAGPIDEVESSYRASGGRASLGEYYLASEWRYEVRPILRERLVFAVHSLATDASFNEFHLIVCRGVLSRFGTELRQRAASVLTDSMCHLGFLVLDSDEAIGENGTPIERLKPQVGIHRRTA